MNNSAAFPEDLLQTLEEYQQTHLLTWWSELEPAQQAELVKQIREINFAQIQRLYAPGSTSSEESPAEKAERATRPATVVRLADRESDSAELSKATEAGKQCLSEGKVGAILVAGGQGSRLGFPHPKGMYPVGPVRQTSLFQILVEQLRARAEQAGQPISYFIMTSDATHDDTVAYFQQNQNFGLVDENLYFFKQGTMPAVDAETGKILLESKHHIAVSPDGHGGMLAALKNSGMFDVMREQGIDTLYYHQVDNPTAIVCDPAFLGYHLQRNAEVSVKVVSKRSADEKMGVVCDVDQKTQIIEYSDLPSHIAERTDEAGQLLHWAGSTAIHVFNRDFLEQIADNDDQFPFHRANKKVPHIDASGSQITPEEPNAIKFERFIFDVLPVADTVLVYEIDREREFNPLKNAEGQDSPTTVHAALNRIAGEWLTACGVEVPGDCPVEISPLLALDAEDLKSKVSADLTINGPLYLGE
ncbi:UTP--glucose-1-phosphate uridylyltransferase [Gimesia chilikensis]|uniref:UTP--glucose-1-phosphate uridylyltransferase n=1 Tax=Gimesia chilikensis TaxID=2605989 RepID=UPI00118BC852|nr:UDPGP type 1 family protein [Gimesia chilikensis]QDT85775.1 putative uridylyltransferase [Gimesia chilikensis]